MYSSPSYGSYSLIPVLLGLGMWVLFHVCVRSSCSHGVRRQVMWLRMFCVPACVEFACGALCCLGAVGFYLQDCPLAGEEIWSLIACLVRIPHCVFLCHSLWNILSIHLRVGS